MNRSLKSRNLIFCLFMLRKFGNPAICNYEELDFSKYTGAIIRHFTQLAVCLTLLQCTTSFKSFNGRLLVYIVPCSTPKKKLKYTAKDEAQFGQ